MSPGSPKLGAMLTTSSIGVAHRGHDTVRSRRLVLVSRHDQAPCVRAAWLPFCRRNARHAVLFARRQKREMSRPDKPFRRLRVIPARSAGGFGKNATVARGTRRAPRCDGRVDVMPALS